MIYRLFGKRIFDIGTSMFGIIVVLPFLFMIGCAVRKRLGKPIFFCQERPGLNGKPFHILKFRTMIDNRGSMGELLPDSKRLTPFGQWMRRTSLDELPELLNVIKGEMSLVGPRPLLMQYLDRYTPKQARRHEVKPGITGWAQINGRNAITWEEKFKLDVWYVDHMSFGLDIKILALTILKVLNREGISQEGHATAEEFNPLIR